ncbi:type II toxin-antitoxin system RelB family antitoxin [Subtercola boreus]|nr:ribbon-helix-helix protein, CopG family [Subtercola boreus]
MSTGVVSVRLPEDLKGRLDALSASTGRPAAFYLREALSEHLGDMEHAYGVLARAEAIRAGARDTVPFDDVMTELGISRSELDGLSSELGE